MLNSVLNGDWSNSVLGRQIPDGRSGDFIMDEGQAEAGSALADNMLVGHHLGVVAVNNNGKLESGSP